MIGNAQTFDDTIGKYPFFYFYDFPNYYYDSLHCDVKNSFASNYAHRNEESEYSFLMHTDDTLYVSGLAVLCHYNGLNRLHLYDSSMALLKTTVDFGDTSCGSFYIRDDSNNVRLFIPHWTNCGMFSDSVAPFEPVSWEDNEVIKIIGDFYIGAQLRRRQANRVFYTAMEINILEEAHEPPYQFPDKPVKVMYDKEWHDTVDPHAIPLIFPIIELPCECSTNVTAAVDEEGCLTVSWDSLERQSQWVVSVESSGLHIVDTVDSCRWQRCGLNPERSYTVRVRSRCDNLQTHTWSNWSEAVTAVPLSGINAVPATDFTLTPNPATGVVAVTTEVGQGTVSVLDLQGRQLLSVPLTGTTTTLDLTGLAAGTYHVRLTTPQGTAVKKLLLR